MKIKELARHVKPLFTHVRARRVPADEAWDIVQETYFTLCLRKESLPESPKEQKSILFEIANNRVCRYFGEQQRKFDRAANAQACALFLGLTHERDISGVVEAREQLEMVLPELSAEQCDVFITKVLDELSIPEVAAQLEMNENTAKGHWLRGRTTLRKRMKNLEERGVRGLVVFLVILTMLALAKNASAMVAWLKRLFRIRNFAPVGSAAAIMLSLPNSGASADACSPAAKYPMAAIPATTAEQSIAPATTSSAVAAVASARQVDSAPVVRKNPAPKAPPPDHLIGSAMTALRKGKPEKALELIEQYPLADAKPADVSTVDMLRAQANAMLAAKTTATH